MKIDTNDYLSYEETRQTLGMDSAALSRAIRRAGRDEVTTTFWGYRVIRRDRLDDILAHYFKRGTERAALAAKYYGHLGGTQKRLNSLRRAGGSDKADTANAG